MTSSAVKRLLPTLIATLMFAFSCRISGVDAAAVAPNITYRLSEDMAIGAQVGDLMSDAGLLTTYPSDERSQFTFSFLPTSTISFLSVDRKSGVLRVSAAIDRSSLCPYADICQLSADVVVAPIFQILRLLIVLLSANRHAPSFPISVFRLNVTASTVPGSMWTLPDADDPDGGVDGVQSYQLKQVFPVLSSSSSPTFALAVVKLSDGSDDVRLRLMTTLDRRVSFRIFSCRLTTDIAKTSLARARHYTSNCTGTLHYLKKNLGSA